jgi:hypothetical protein
MKLWNKVSEVSIQRDISAGMLEVNDIPVAERGNFDPVHPSVCSCINGLAFDTTEFVIQSCMKVIGSEFGKVAGKVISTSRFDRRSEIAFLDFLGRNLREKEKTKNKEKGGKLT